MHEKSMYGTKQAISFLQGATQRTKFSSCESTHYLSLMSEPLKTVSGLCQSLIRDSASWSTRHTNIDTAHIFNLTHDRPRHGNRLWQRANSKQTYCYISSLAEWRRSLVLHNWWSKPSLNWLRLSGWLIWSQTRTAVPGWDLQIMCLFASPLF